MLLIRLLPLSLLACVPELTSPPGAEGPAGPWEAPENSWPVCEAPPDGFEGSGYAVGDTAPDFLFGDQYGAQVSLWQWHGCTVVLDISTMWCAPCQELAEEAQAIADDYRDDEVVYVTIMPQDLGSDPPDTDELMEWSEGFELVEPILSDDAGYSYNVVTGARGFPAVLIIDRDGVIVDDLPTVTDEAIRQAIDAAL
jgi:thiol-disulfide isomerase/thioredoxin